MYYNTKLHFDRKRVQLTRDRERGRKKKTKFRKKYFLYGYHKTKFQKLDIALKKTLNLIHYLQSPSSLLSHSMALSLTLL